MPKKQEDRRALTLCSLHTWVDPLRYAGLLIPASSAARPPVGLRVFQRSRRLAVEARKDRGGCLDRERRDERWRAAI